MSLNYILDFLILTPNVLRNIYLSFIYLTLLGMLAAWFRMKYPSSVAG